MGVRCGPWANSGLQLFRSAPSSIRFADLAQRTLGQTVVHSQLPSNNTPLAQIFPWVVFNNDCFHKLSSTLNYVSSSPGPLTFLRVLPCGEYIVVNLHCDLHI